MGKLNCRARTEHFVYLNCIFAGGLDELVESIYEMSQVCFAVPAYDLFFYVVIIHEFIFSDTENTDLFGDNTYFGDTYLQGGANTAVLNFITGASLLSVIT